MIEWLKVPFHQFLLTLGFIVLVDIVKYLVGELDYRNAQRLSREKDDPER